MMVLIIDLTQLLIVNDFRWYRALQTSKDTLFDGEGGHSRPLFQLHSFKKGLQLFPRGDYRSAAQVLVKAGHLE